MPDRQAHLLTNAVRHYAWGSRTVLPRLLGAEGAADEPWAEVWMGAHPLEPSWLADGRSLAEVEPGLPFLVKLLAAEDPLSIQAHPDRDQAGAGYADEEARGVERSAPHRSYKDPNHKPELLVAIEPTEALCGFRGILAVRGLAHGLGSAAWQELVEQTCGPGTDDATGLRALLTELLTCGGPHLAGLVADILAAGAQLPPDGDPALARVADWVRRLSERYPGDPGVLAPLLLELVVLAPGDGLFVAAGVLHSYLHGAGVEVQATSDNVLRGGLTTKHVDVLELVRTVRFVPAAPDQRVSPRPVGDGLVAYDVPVDDFAVSCATPRDVPGGTVALTTSGPAIVVALDGNVRVAGLDLGPGRSAYVAGSGVLVVSGAGTCLVASTP
jgi:mannose-6-phosphate isomerase